MSDTHIPVMLSESITALAIKPNGCYFDGTFGLGGHSRAILDVLGTDGQLYATDRDPHAVEVAMAITDSRFFFKRGAFSGINDYFPQLGKESLDGVFLDLGVSSPQLDKAERGFSFSRDGALDMRMDPTLGISAKDFVNGAEVGKIANVIARMGEERFAKQIARQIEKARKIQTIETTMALAEIVKKAIPTRFHQPGRHPATRTFQAIRIWVNQELDELKKLLSRVYPMLKPRGRLVVISFHSLEDALVKDFVKAQAGQDVPPELPILDSSIFKKLQLLGRPIRPSQEEVANNSRSRSALMRVVEKR